MPKLEISRVHDGYAKGGECPLCPIMDEVERTYLLSFQGPRVMEPNVRVKTNEAGFCPDHYRKLYRGENKLGLGLVVHTHLQQKLPALEAALEKVLEQGPERGRKSRGSAAERLDSLDVLLKTLRGSCFICDMLATDLDRYVFTIVYLWKSDAGFHDTFTHSRGFCLHHFTAVLAKARETLRGDELGRFLADLVPLMAGSLTRLERDLFSFTQLFHDANRSLGSEDERTALARTLQKLAGSLMKTE